MREEEKKQSRPASLEDVGRRVDEEIEGMIRWFNDEVIPSVRQHSTRALRTASEKLTQLADHMDDLKSK